MKQRKQEISRKLGTIWVLEHAEASTKSIVHALELHYAITAFAKVRHLEKALNTPRPKPPGLLIAEISLPDGAIFEILQKNQSLAKHVMILTTTNDPEIISTCLELGIADYFIKPADPHLLKAKVDRFFRAKRSNESGIRTGIRLDAFFHKIHTEKFGSVDLTVKEFQIFSLLYQAYPKRVGKEEMYRSVWKDARVITKTFDVHLFKLRKKIDAIGFRVHFWPGGKYSLVKSER
jgi:DNA-binding response OmpR family regulator